MCIASSSGATPSRSCRTCSCAATARASGSRRPTSTSRSPRRSPPMPPRRGATTVPAHVLYDIVRKLPEGAQVSLETAGDSGQMQIRSGRSRFTLQALPRERLPRSRGGRDAVQVLAAAGGSEAPHRQDAVRDLDRGDALLPQRHLLAHDRAPAGSDAARRRDRRPPARPRRNRGAGRRRGHARRDRSAQDRRRDPEAHRGRRGPVGIELSDIEDPLRPSAAWC